jgi:ADP-heptose:LPS heptosyltransferase
VAVSAPRVVILRALGLGDLCTGVPALRAVAAAFPDHQRLLAAPAWQAPIARQCGVDRVVATTGLQPLPHELASADVTVDLHGRGPQSIRLLARLRPDRMIAFRHTSVPQSWAGPEWRHDEHEIDRWCRLLAHFDVPADRHDLHLAPIGLPPAGVDDRVIVHPGAAALGRRWPPSRFAAVIAGLLAAGEGVVLTGSEAERALCRQIREESGAADSAGVLDLSGRTDLEQLCATVAAAKAVLSNDTGIAHLAVAYGVPTVTLFGPTSPAMWGPPDDPRHRVIWHGTTGDPHAPTLDPGLDLITVPEVTAAVADVLQFGPRLRPPDLRQVAR